MMIITRLIVLKIYTRVIYNIYLIPYYNDLIFLFIGHCRMFCNCKCFSLMIFIHYTNVYRFVFPRGGDVGKLVLNNNEMADLNHRYILILNDYLYILHDVDAYLT